MWYIPMHSYKKKYTLTGLPHQHVLGFFSQNPKSRLLSLLPLQNTTGKYPFT